MGDGVVGRVADDSLHSVGKPAPVGDRVGDAVGHLAGRVDVCDDLCGGVGSDNATQSRPVRKMCVRPLDPILETLIECCAR